MPIRAPRICVCGNVVPFGTKCACQIRRDKERKERFDRARPNATSRGYGSKWRAYREHFLRKNPICAMCGALASIVDHIKPHKGDKKLFWDPLNHQSLCEHCHNTTKQSLEKRNAKPDQRNGK